MVPLVRLLDLSPSGWSLLEVTQTRFCLARASLDHSSFFTMSAPLVGFVSQSVPQAQICVSKKKNHLSMERL